MKHTQPISRLKPGTAEIGRDDLEFVVSFFRSILSLLQQAHEVLGIPLPNKAID